MAAPRPGVSFESTTVTVACKLPHGLVIRDHVKKHETENIFGGDKTKRVITVFRPVGPRIRIKGPNVPLAFLRMIEIVDGYAITRNVPADVMGRWLEHNAGSPIVRNHMIFAHEDHESVVAWCKEHATARSGMEPLDVTMVTRDGVQKIADPRVQIAKGLAIANFSSDAA